MRNVRDRSHSGRSVARVCVQAPSRSCCCQGVGAGEQDARTGPDAPGTRLPTRPCPGLRLPRPRPAGRRDCEGRAAWTGMKGRAVAVPSL